MTNLLKAVKVTWIIAIVLIIVLGYGCKESPRYELPETIDHPIAGKAAYITSKMLIDSVNSGADLRLYFLREETFEDTTYIVPIPGMITLPLGEMPYVADTLSKDKPIYLICQYGDDSKKMAENFARRRGFDCYFLDGGNYRLHEQMQQHQWRILPRPQRNN
ncbi:MAG: rhodanese-like domain-containing protein [Candidatus Electryoneaceae bacterium]|nr:rhodanese-like domain-containing protein [Candidatus Electryoneaceae bacterium]